MDLLSNLQQAGVDTTEALRRFVGKRELYERFLYKFLQDESFGKIGPALTAGDCKAAFEAAHTLKGVCGNLGMKKLYNSCCELVDPLRVGDIESAKNRYPAMQEAYEEIFHSISDGGDSR